MIDIKPPPFSTTNAVAHENMELTFEKLVEAVKPIKREHFIYVIASAMVPDDAYGVLFVREEDAKKWNKK